MGGRVCKQKSLLRKGFCMVLGNDTRGSAQNSSHSSSSSPAINEGGDADNNQTTIQVGRMALMLLGLKANTRKRFEFCN